MATTITRWDFGVEVNAPCADISFANASDRHVLALIMHFSRVNDGIPQDLEIIFDRPCGMTWQDEALYSVSVEWPKPLPGITEGNWAGWTYPFLLVNQSPWVGTKDEYLPQVRGQAHLVLVAMNDIVELVANPAPKYRWLSTT